MLNDCKTLEELWDVVHELNQTYFPENELMPILGNGKTYRPKIMFIFINPTHLNISSKKEWKGPRFPFMGTKPIWRIFHRAGLFPDELINIINTSPWTLDFTEKVLAWLTSQSFYFTNIVKWTGSDATLPDAKKISLFLPILQREIELVQPEYIVTFGLIPFEKLTKQKIKLQEYYDEVMKNKRINLIEQHIGNTKVKIIPCYFPVGRGNPKKAVEMLKIINHNL